MIRRLTKPEDMGLPGVFELFMEAPIFDEQDLKVRARKIATLAQELAIATRWYALCAWDEETHRPVGLSLVCLPNSILAPIPFWVAVYCERAPKIRKALITETLNFMRAQGYNRVQGVNGTGRADKALERLYSLGGHAKNMRTIGSLVEYEL